MRRVMKGRWALKSGLYKTIKPHMVDVEGPYIPYVHNRPAWKGWYSAIVTVSSWPFRISYYELVTYYNRI